MPAPPIKAKLLTSSGEVSMPHGWKSPMRNADGTVKPLFQLFVERVKDGRPQAVGPATLEDTVRKLCAEVQKQIIAGRERNWSNPTVVKVRG